MNQKTVNNLLKPYVIEIIMSNEQYKTELIELMKSPEWGEALFGDWLQDKVDLLKQANKKLQESEN